MASRHDEGLVAYDIHAALLVIFQKTFPGLVPHAAQHLYKDFPRHSYETIMKVEQPDLYHASGCCSNLGAG